MKVFHIITQMEAGGAQGAAVRNSRYFNENFNVDSKVIFLYKKRDVYSGSDIITLLNRSPRGVFDLFHILKKLYVLLKDNSDCRVICYTHYANVIGAIVAKIAGVQNIVISHRNPVQTYPRLCKCLDFIAGCLPIYSKCIGVSQTVCDSFKNYPKIYKNKIRLIYNGIAVRDNHVDSSIINDFSWIREKSNGDIILVSTGRLHPQKNQTMLINAMADVNNAKLYIAGDGELKPEFEKLIESKMLSDRVFLIGEIQPHKVYDFLSIGDVFVFPSNYEAFGFSVVEAMAAGLPIICSDIPAMNEIVADAGIILDKNNSEIWSETIKNISEAKLKELSNKSVERASIFQLKKMAESYYELVNEYD